MKKIILVILIFVIVGVSYWLISPLFINKKVGEKIEDISKVGLSSTQIVAQGTFSGLGGHNAEGSAKLLKIGDRYYLRFEDDFRVTNGPDLFVHFGKNSQYDAEARVAVLKGNVGGQNYEIPVNINPLDYNEVWIWCRSFSVPFGKATLK